MRPDDFDAETLAGEHVMGLTEGADHARAEALIASDPDFRARVAYWRERLAEIDRSAPTADPSPALWDRIAARVAAVGPTPSTRTAVVPPTPSLLQRLWASLPAWRMGALAAAAAALILAVGLTREIANRLPAIELVAVLETSDNRPAAVVNVYADGTATLVPLRTFEVPSDRVIQVWTLQSREQGPVSVGLMSQARTLRLDLGRLGRPGEGHLFEMTLEPTGGSPTGRPTGPILVKGLATRSL